MVFGVRELKTPLNFCPDFRKVVSAYV